MRSQYLRKMQGVLFTFLRKFATFPMKSCKEWYEWVALYTESAQIQNYVVLTAYIYVQYVCKILGDICRFLVGTLDTLHKITFKIRHLLLLVYYLLIVGCFHWNDLKHVSCLFETYWFQYECVQPIPMVMSSSIF